MNSKICKLCGIEKLDSEYFFCKRRLKLYSHCKKCNAARGKANKEKRKEEYNQKRRETRHKYKEKESAYSKKYYAEKIKPNNKGRSPAKTVGVKKERKTLTEEERKRYHANYREKNRERLKAQARQYRIDNKENINKRDRERSKFMSQHNRIRHNLRVRMRRCIQDKRNHSIDLIGCDIEFVRLYLESKFTSGMTWRNYGIKGWHIDHIIPCSSFNLQDEDERKRCFHYTNLQPLWATREIAMRHGESSSYIGNLEKGHSL